MKIVPPNKDILAWLNSIILPTDEVLDIGCGEKRYKLETASYVGIDIWAPCNPTLQINLAKVDIPLRDDSFDIVMLLDFIEHLPKERAKQILQQAKDICKRQVLVMTPIAWDTNTASFANPESIHFRNKFDIHQSHWKEEDFDEPGWRRDIILRHDARKESSISKKMLTYRWTK